MSTISDDEIIKRKLLIEGESGNDDRRITLLLKNYLRWIASNDVGNEGSDAFQALIGSVYQCENSMEQAALVLNMNGEQQKQYTELFKDIGLLSVCMKNTRQSENQMERARKRIEACKEELSTAKVIRKNRREYDGLAKIIAEHPERSETLA
ncbi:Tho complex subunit 7 [Fasciola gigantica]|uniref:Tho complex subunit 7 n=2 Tax=Fasciola TaxID=6191 RepID=A0A2H1CJ24_FASHE|nr:Tho complex subunit 7 [Fasciola hepatica]TPP61348.1 Tho complex subunit 7 [Fasciola gigantica]